MTDAKLKSYVERIDRVMTAMDEARADIAKIIKDAKGDGYIPKTLRKVATRYHADPSKIATEDALLETYEAALGRVGRALADIRAGATWKDASEKHDVPRATMARAAAVSKRREMIPADADPLTGEVREEGCGPGASAVPPAGPIASDGTPPQPDHDSTTTGENHGEGCLSDRGDGSDEHSTSCGGVESRHAGASGEGDLGPRASVTCEASDRVGDNSRPTRTSQPEAGVAPGPQDTDTAEADMLASFDRLQVLKREKGFSSLSPRDADI